jgi:hypothetical protein
VWLRVNLTPSHKTKQHLNPKRKSRSLEKRSFKQLVIFKYMHHEKKQTLKKKQEN